MDQKRTLLFACRQNAGRSQIAAAIARSLAPSSITVLSAGTTPATEIHPGVRQLLGELGLTPVDPSPKLLTTKTVEESDWVVTMGCGESCPIFPGKHYEDWPVQDPAGADEHTTRLIFEDIRTRVSDLLERIEQD